MPQPTATRVVLACALALPLGLVACKGKGGADFTAAGSASGAAGSASAPAGAPGASALPSGAPVVDHRKIVRTGQVEL